MPSKNPRVVARRMPAALLLLLLLLPIRVLAGPDKVISSGVYADSAGQQHPWTITAGHTLEWQRQPYIPVGGTFCPRYLAEGATEENWAKDVQGLEQLKTRGAQDVLINPVVSAVSVKPEAWQRLIDYLESHGFRYGIAFGAGVVNPLTGVIVKPTAYRIEGIQRSDDVAWPVSDADSAFYVVAEKSDGALIRHGAVTVKDGIATVPGSGQAAENPVGILYPRKSFRVNAEGGLPDLWSGYDSYRDRLLAVFSKVKLGPGLRFFIDPLAHPLAIPDEAESLVPDSPAFRLEWEAYLSRTYSGGIDDLMTRWKITARDIKDYSQAARLIPLGFGVKGVAYFLDPADGKVFEMEGDWHASRFWSDLFKFRDESILAYMNGAADLLKRQVADVPVVYTWTQPKPFFSNKDPRGGFDGLGMAAYGRGSALVTGGADSAYSQAEEGARTEWCLVTEMAGSAHGQAGYASQEALFSDLNWLRSIGARGFFLNGFQVLPAGSSRSCQLLDKPDQVAWLKDYGDKLHREGDPGGGASRTLPYPATAAGIVRSGPIGGSGVWWIPSVASGRLLEFGSSYEGYTISLPAGDETVLWSLRGPRETHIHVKDIRAVEVLTPDGEPAKVKTDKKKTTITVVLDQNPTVFRGVDSEFFPTEAAEDALRSLKALIKEGEAEKLPIDPYRSLLTRAVNDLKLQDPRLAFVHAAEALNTVLPVVQPYTWIEGELAVSHTFTEVIPDEAASNRAYLSLSADARASRAGHTAQYTLVAPADDTYAVWIACSPPGQDVSPFAWSVDTEEPHASEDASVVGSPFLGDRFVWMRLGSAKLKRGEHKFTLRATRPASGTNRYSLAIDSILLTRAPFTPNGITRPPLPEVPLTDKDAEKPKRAAPNRKAKK